MAGIATARIKSESKTTTIPAGENGKVSAECGPGSEAVAGGFASPGFDPTFDTRTVIIFASKRGGERKWTAQGFNFGLTGGKFKSYAYCDTSEPNLRVESKTMTVGPFDTGSATAKCPRGSEAVSGGWTSRGVGQSDDGQYASESRRKGDRKWKVSAFNQDNADARPLVTFAYCDNHGPNLKAKSDSVNIPPGEKRSAKANCGGGDKAYSGGFKGTATPGTVNGTGPVSSKRTGGGDWQAKGFNNDPTTTRQFKVYAYCA
jgi:hypothetical protein